MRRGMLHGLSGARTVTSDHHSFHINLRRRRRSVQHRVDHSTMRGCLQVPCSLLLLKLRCVDLSNQSHNFIPERPRVMHHSSNTLSITIKDMSHVPTTPQFLSTLASNPRSGPCSLRTRDFPWWWRRVCDSGAAASFEEVLPDQKLRSRPPAVA